LRLCLENGAKLADKGEFTKRAFLNGKLSLTQAEAVMDTISAQGEYALNSANLARQGRLFKNIKAVTDKLVGLLGELAAWVDYPEDDIPEVEQTALENSLAQALSTLDRIIADYDRGLVFKSGIDTCIAGKPNVGKSSLLNMLSEKDRAIVTDIPGTTRDILEEKVRIGDITLHILDTAGIRETTDVVEQIGVSKAEASVEDADLILYVVDSSIPLDDNDVRIQSTLKDHSSHTIILLNKSDLNSVVSEEELRDLGVQVISVSMKDGSGVDDLKQAITTMFFHGDISSNDDLLITNERHKFLLQQAKKSLSLVQDSIALGMTEDFFAGDLMDAYESLGSIIGEAVEDDLVNEIFSKFCMGK
jgi:tRNA modification GTPase